MYQENWARRPFKKLTREPDASLLFLLIKPTVTACVAALLRPCLKRTLNPFIKPQLQPTSGSGLPSRIADYFHADRVAHCPGRRALRTGEPQGL